MTPLGRPEFTLGVVLVTTVVDGDKTGYGKEVPRGLSSVTLRLTGAWTNRDNVNSDNPKGKT